MRVAALVHLDLDNWALLVSCCHLLSTTIFRNDARAHPRRKRCACQDTGDAKSPIRSRARNRLACPLHRTALV